MTAPWPPIGDVYFVTDGEAIKIGVSTFLKLRLQDLQTSNHRTLQVIGTIPGGPDMERRLHKRFEHLWLRGEWYRAESELLSFIHEEVAVRNEVKQVRQELQAWKERQVSLEVKAASQIVADDLSVLIENPEDGIAQRRITKNISELGRLKRKPLPLALTGPRLSPVAQAAIAAARHHL